MLLITWAIAEPQRSGSAWIGDIKIIKSDSSNGGIQFTFSILGIIYQVWSWKYTHINIAQTPNTEVIPNLHELEKTASPTLKWSKTTISKGKNLWDYFVFTGLCLSIPNDLCEIEKNIRVKLKRLLQTHHEVITEQISYKTCFYCWAFFFDY